MESHSPIWLGVEGRIMRYAGSVSAETVEVAYHGEVDLDRLKCTEIAPGSRVQRVCYDEANRYVLVRYEETWQHFCAVEAAIVDRYSKIPRRSGAIPPAPTER